VRRLLPLLVLAIAILLAAAPSAAARTIWLCKPGLASNPCLANLTTTVIESDGSTRVEHTRRPRRPKIDCFYVYPTVSAQPGVNATRDKDPEVLAVARIQASRFSPRCRVFAPVYRQLTLAAIGSPSIDPAAAARAYRDVVAAWRTYLRRYNRGRGVVLIGHSQGTFMLRRLVSTRIDTRPAVRRRLVSALLLGGDVTVREGRDRGGDFRHIPACRRPGQTGCVVAYSAFSEPPPADSVFGRPRSRYFQIGDVSGLEILCTNPAALSGDGGALRPYLPTRRFPGPLGEVQDPPPQGVATYWAATPRLYRARCASGGGADWLQVDDAGGPGDTRQRVTQSIGPTWGLHLVDVNLAYGNLVEVVRRQARAYLR
jgi:Protein of unknown function (DUF3089)